MRRKDLHHAAHERLAARNRTVSNWRLVAFTLCIVAAWAAFSSEFELWWPILPAVILFITLVFFHSHIIECERRESLAVSYYQDGRARLEDKWQGRGPTGARFAEHDHPYASDLDLFGRGSLFSLLSAARTHGGE